ncbi:hypothetical protein V6N11_050447 [Hibiscus sabdariffa]|uniref:DUF4283 domain-containing protein n=1 Tax=Hibiscus sabdariffa TaxID=183260 RepID=A0ABR2T9Z9_9ROSI
MVDSIATGDQEIVGGSNLAPLAPIANNLDLSHFPTLAESSGKEIESSAWKLFDPALAFFPPIAQKGKLLVQPPRDVLDVGAQQWSNALVGTFMGKSPILSVFQKTVDRLWRREGSVTIRFLAPSVYMVNFPSQKVHDWVLESGSFGYCSEEVKGLGYLASAIEENCTKKNVSASGLIVDEDGEGVGMQPAPEVVVEFGFGGLTVDSVACSIVGAPAMDKSLGVDCAAVIDTCLVGDGLVDTVSAHCVSDCVVKVPDGDDNLISVVGDKNSIVSGSGSAFVSPNKFNTLSYVEMDHVVSPRKKRLAAAGVGDLLNQLKPKGKGVVNGLIRKEKQLELKNVQKLLLANPYVEMIAREKQVAMDLKALIMAEESYFRQKSMIQFVKEGDQNTSFFFRKVQIQQKANTITSLQNNDGVKLVSFGDISNEFVKFFTDFLRSVDDSVDRFPDDLLKQILVAELTAEMKNALVAPERNDRLHGRKARTVEEIFLLIKQVVR